MSKILTAVFAMLLLLTGCGDDDDGGGSSTDSGDGVSSDTADYLAALEANGYGDFFVSDRAAAMYLTNTCNAYADLGEAVVEDDIDRLTVDFC